MNIEYFMFSSNVFEFFNCEIWNIYLQLVANYCQRRVNGLEQLLQELMMNYCQLRAD